MAISQEVEKILREAIKREDEASLEYGDLASDTPMSNIRWFLTAFSQARKEMKDKLTSILEEKADDFGKPEEHKLHLQATEHLDFDGTVDDESLQSVLLFISRRELDDLEYFRSMVESVHDRKVGEKLKSVMEDKSNMLAKADRLYHDLIEN